MLLVKLPANLLFSYHQQTKRLKTHPLKIAGRSSLSHDKALVMGGIDIVWAKYFNLHINKPIQDGGEAKAPLWLNRLSGTD